MGMKIMVSEDWTSRAFYAGIGFLGAMIAALNLQQYEAREVWQTILTGPAVAFAFTDYALGSLNLGADMWMPVAFALGALGTLIIRRVTKLFSLIDWHGLLSVLLRRKD